MPTATTLEYLAGPENFPERPPVAVIFGDEAFLRAEAFKLFRRRILTDEDAEFSYSEHDGGSDLRFADLMLELSSPPIFGGDVRLVRITDADRFVSAYKEELVDYLNAPSKVGVLVLQVKTFLKTSNFYKTVEKAGLLVEAAQPDRRALTPWLQSRAKEYGAAAEKGAIEQLYELIGEEPGLLDGEIRRLALLNPPDGKLTKEFVLQNVGSWKLQKAWDIVADALSGDLPKAVRQLDVLLASGEQPIAVLAQMGVVLRKYWAATEFYLAAEKKSPRQSPGALIGDALKSAKIFIPYRMSANDPKHPVNLMKRLGRRRGERLAKLLLQADLDLKGGQRIDPRIVIEELLAELASRDLRDGAYIASKRPLRD
ncbi:MAG: DNA polymerase III subunit delta [Thermoguttaceae bacterium]|nr:DNA polymerase III subunit delta [Thermoguttaceae bacterium]